MATATIAAFLAVQVSGPDACDGVAAEVGGCADPQPAFSASGCESLAREIAGEMAARGVRIVEDGDTSEMTLATRLGNDRVLVFVRASQHAAGQHLRCEPDEVAGTVWASLGEDYRATATQHLYDADEVTWTEADLAAQVDEAALLLEWWR